MFKKQMKLSLSPFILALFMVNFGLFGLKYQVYADDDFVLDSGEDNSSEEFVSTDENVVIKWYTEE